MSTLRIESLTCSYEDLVAVNDWSMTIESGEFVTLLGPSGSGKTTLLRAIGGYIQPASGQILVDDEDITGLPPQARNIGMVFQNYALFPHLRVEDNIAFGLEVRKVPRDEIQSRVADVLDTVHLRGKEQSYPHELSGGQQQRVALARAIVIQPDLLLMDEPLGALDLKLREAMQDQVRTIQQELGITTVYVTHDQEEAFAMSDRVALIEQGELVEIGSPRELYVRPQTRFGAEFVGQANLVPCRILDWSRERASVALEPWDIKTTVTQPRTPIEGASSFVLIRPDSIQISRSEILGGLSGTVKATRFTGMRSMLWLDVSGHELVVLDRAAEFQVGDELHLGWSESETSLVYERKTSSDA